MKKIRKISFLLLMVIFLSSCNRDTVFEDYWKFDNLTWNRFDFVTFEMDVEDIEQYYDIFLVFRHVPEFPVSKLELNFTVLPPSGGYRSSDHSYWLRKSGVLQSDCLGDYCDFLVPLRKEYKFNETGSTRFEIENKIPKFESTGIIEVGLIIRKSKISSKQ